MHQLNGFHQLLYLVVDFIGCVLIWCPREYCRFSLITLQCQRVFVGTEGLQLHVVSLVYTLRPIVTEPTNCTHKGHKHSHSR